MASRAIPVTLQGRLVAIAGPTRCHVLRSDLSEHDLSVVLLTCLFMRREAGSGADPDELNERAEAWARRLMAGDVVSRPQSG
jgi:hypothetical protein